MHFCVFNILIYQYTLQEKPSENASTESAYHSNGPTATGADPFGAHPSANSSTTSGFASTFGAPSNGGGGGSGFDDSFGSAFGGQKSRHDDPFHSSSSATGAPTSADPFGDKAAGNKAITPDVCRSSD